MRCAGSREALLSLCLLCAGFLLKMYPLLLTDNPSQLVATVLLLSTVLDVLLADSCLCLQVSIEEELGAAHAAPESAGPRKETEHGAWAPLYRALLRSASALLEQQPDQAALGSNAGSWAPISPWAGSAGTGDTRPLVERTAEDSCAFAHSLIGGCQPRAHSIPV